MVQRRVLALDLSSKRTGWATKVNGDLEYGAITATSSNVEERLITMVDSVLEIIKEYNINYIVAEEVRPDNTNIHTSKILTWLQGAVILNAYQQYGPIGYELIGASTWRSKIGIQGYRIKREEQKQRDIEYVQKIYGITTKDDEADAICLLSAFEVDEQPKLKKPKGAW